MRILFSLLLLALTLAGQAQNRGAAVLAAYNDKLAQDLNLDSARKLRVSAANEQYLSAVSAAFRSQNERRTRSEAIKAARERQERELKQVLTSEQWKQYERLRAEQRRKLAETSAKKVAEEVTMTQQEKLGLSTEQSTKAYDINTRFLQVALIALTDEDEGGLRKLRTLRDAGETRDAEMEKLLSNEQFQQYRKLNEEQRQKLMDRWGSRKQ